MLKIPGITLVICGMVLSQAQAEEKAIHSFDRVQLTGTYFSEGANAGDINGDGQPDVVYGPYWYAGPDFKQKHEIYPPKPQPVEGYADNFFNWIYDFNGDGANDIFVVGFPGTPAYVYENPKGEGLKQHWKKHTVFQSVGNESPQLIDIVGDSRPELVCTFKSGFGFVTINWEKPFDKWQFHRISTEKAPDRFGHGLGVGDVNGDGLQDILTANGWFQQPAKNALESLWEFHAQSFTNAYGGAEMYAYDVDGDGDNDIITTLAAHDFGLAWYEQDRSGPKPVFKMHLIMGDRPAQNKFGLVFSELHSLALVDVDNDGLKDLVTGKTYYSHHKGSPMWDAGAVVYWFRLTRTKNGVEYVPYKADTEAGIGRQVSIADVNGDKLPDIVVGGMKGSHVLIHKKRNVSEAEYQKAQPVPIQIQDKPAPKGPAAKINPQTGRVDHALEAEELKVVKASAGKTGVQEMKGFTKGKWSGGKQLFWTGGKPGSRLDLELSVPFDGEFEIFANFTLAPDFGTIRLELDAQPMGDTTDLYNAPDVISTGELKFGKMRTGKGLHKLSVIITGANPSAVQAHLVGLDYIRLKPVKQQPE